MAHPAGTQALHHHRTTKMKNNVLFIIGLLLCGSAVASEFPGIEALMTAEEQQAAGIQKLTVAEKEALNKWLIRYTVNEAPVTQISGAETEKAKIEGIVSRIDGAFNGWTGKTVFKLENGQVWKQRLPSTWIYSAESPNVKITRNWLGYYVMDVEGKRQVGVSKIK